MFSFYITTNLASDTDKMTTRYVCGSVFFLYALLILTFDISWYFITLLLIYVAQKYLRKKKQRRKRSKISVYSLFGYEFVFRLQIQQFPFGLAVDFPTEIWSEQTNKNICLQQDIDIFFSVCFLTVIMCDIKCNVVYIPALLSSKCQICQVCRICLSCCYLCKIKLYLDGVYRRSYPKGWQECVNFCFD